MDAENRSCRSASGALLAAVGAEQPLAVGVVSVPRRDPGTPIRPTDTLPLRIPAGRPYIYGTAQLMSGFSLRVAFGLSREGRYRVSNVEGLAYSAGIRPDDFLYSLNGRSIAAEADMLEAVSHLWSGDVVPVRLERGGRMMDLSLPLGPDSHGDQYNYRADDFPTVIECAVPFYSYECGGPIVDLTGRAIGVTIARVAEHGGMVIPGDCVLDLLPDLQSGRLAGNRAPGRSRRGKDSHVGVWPDTVLYDRDGRSLGHQSGGLYRCRLDDRTQQRATSV